jgi:hypothetical protein
MNIDMASAILSLRPGAIWSLSGNTYEGLFWSNQNDLPPPTEEELQAEGERLQQEWKNIQYQRDRAVAYPSIQDQLDTLYHQGYDGWKVTIDEVKNKYPKPGEDL